jgi:hypothetical protein
MLSLIKINLLSLILLSGALLLTQHADATGIYKSVDADGKVTYSARPPSDAVTIEKITITPDYSITPSADTMANIDAIKQTADQLEKERKQREQERKDKLKQTEEAAKKQTTSPVESEIRYYPVYPFYFYPGRPPLWRPHRPRPTSSQPPIQTPNPLPDKSGR